MTLTTHAIIGAAVAKIFSANPLLAGVAAFASHFLIDAIPHWDYHPRSFTRDETNPLNDNMEIGPHFLFDFIFIVFDALWGTVFSLLLFWPTDMYQFWIIVAGAVLGILPDPFQFLYWKTRVEPFITIQKFHIWIHSENKRLTDHPLMGMILQVVLVLIVIVPVIYFSS